MAKSVKIKRDSNMLHGNDVKVIVGTVEKKLYVEACVPEGYALPIKIMYDMERDCGVEWRTPVTALINGEHKHTGRVEEVDDSLLEEMVTVTILLDDE